MNQPSALKARRVIVKFEAQVKAAEGAREALRLLKQSDLPLDPEARKLLQQAIDAQAGLIDRYRIRQEGAIMAITEYLGTTYVELAEKARQEGWHDQVHRPGDRQQEVAE